MTDSETEESISNIITKWEDRKKLISKLGNGIFSMAVYSKIIRMSTPINENCLLLVSIDPTESYQEIITEIIKLKTNNFLI
ncbi:MAG: hypothetical protein ACW9W4_08650 [Candidatus Nitrosopumilus sp. bin_7KS]